MGEKQTSTLVWQDRMTFEATTTYGHKIVIDAQPPEGDNHGPKPIELLLTALGGCSALDVISILQKKREPVQGLEVFVEGERASEHPMVYTNIEVVYRVRGNVNPVALERAIELSLTKYCGVHAMLSKSAKLTHRFEILDSTLAPAGK